MIIPQRIKYGQLYVFISIYRQPASSLQNICLEVQIVNINEALPYIKEMQTHNSNAISTSKNQHSF